MVALHSACAIRDGFWIPSIQVSPGSSKSDAYRASPIQSPNPVHRQTQEPSRFPHKHVRARPLHAYRMSTINSACIMLRGAAIPSHPRTRPFFPNPSQPAQDASQHHPIQICHKKISNLYHPTNTWAHFPSQPITHERLNPSRYKLTALRLRQSVHHHPTQAAPSKDLLHGSWTSDENGGYPWVIIHRLYAVHHIPSSKWR